MKKIISLILVALCMFSMVACGQQTGNSEDALNQMMNGKFIIDDKEYFVDGIHEQLITDGWITVGEDHMLESKCETILFYFHEDYGTDITNFHISVSYFNNSDESKKIIECDVSTIRFKEARKKCPKFGVEPNVVYGKTTNKIKKICSPTLIESNLWKYKGTESTKVKQLIIDFGKNDKLEAIELSFK